MLHEKHNTKHDASGDTSAPCSLPPAHSAGMTLIELLVVITILTTLVAGVIPLLSPNNEPRKLREAARELQSYITQTQAEAARTGRPHGIGFRESTAGSGVALEVYQLEVPQPFAGFSDESRVVVAPNGGFYGTQSGQNGGTKFDPLYRGYPLYNITFELATGGSDLYPPRFIRLGDEIHIDGNIFLIVDDDDPSSDPNLIDTSNGLTLDQEYLFPDIANPEPVVCIWLNNNGQVIPNNRRSSYQIVRQPSNSPEPPLTLPRGIGIDMVASGLEISGQAGIIGDNQFHSGLTAIENVGGVMFAPSGRVESVYLNGQPSPQVSRVMLLLGRVENVSVGRPMSDYDFDSSITTEDGIEDARDQLNWLNPDSTWMAISARNGRVLSSSNRFLDLQSTAVKSFDYNVNNDTLAVDPFDQIYAAREYAREMRREGGR